MRFFATSTTFLAYLRYSIADESLTTIAGLALNTPSLSDFFELALAADLVELLADCSSGPFTVFAPINEEFEHLGLQKLNSLKFGGTGTSQLLRYHVLPKKLMLTDLENKKYSTAQGEKLKIRLKTDGDPVIVNSVRSGGAKFITADIEACNGVVHVVDSVLTPPLSAYLVDSVLTPPLPISNLTLEQTLHNENLPSIADLAQSSPDLSSFFELANAADFGGLLADCSSGPFTVMAPTNENFEKEGAEKAKIRLIKDGTISIVHLLRNTGPTEVILDIEACNGVIHVVNSVIPPPSLSDTAILNTPTLEHHHAQLPSIADLASTTPSLLILSELAKAAGLTNFLADCRNGPFTVFAPTNKEFKKLGSQKLDKLIFGNATEASKLVLHHVLSGKFLKTELNNDKYYTAIGETVTVQLYRGGRVVKVNKSYRKNGAKVVKRDIEACNGVVHVVNSVLRPPR